MATHGGGCSVWVVVKMIFIKYLPVICHQWRKAIAKGTLWPL
ncbi:hypothetical protein CSB93_2796 [Pseudomonas paraeruginosa]|uniref:Uncharacterized protein n=1 Tax=Pseudomonas paraeruginosa TaxID=2994495 RepID=A0A2R3IR41_9PSED|nr:hypothetical protein CSB93_2796 [Pseudomonas paraeruginosa]AWE90546.1 hypothetical protein CSC28_1567 [Pseudomonas paraeruginosa]